MPLIWESYPGVSLYSEKFTPGALTESGTQPPSETQVPLDKKTAYLATREQEGFTVADLTLAVCEQQADSQKQ